MTTNGGIYPAIGRFFRTKKELADAACMSPTKLWRCLKGKQSFTENEQKAIVRAILLKLYAEGKEQEMKEMFEALTDFDKYFKKGV